MDQADAVDRSEVRTKLIASLKYNLLSIKSITVVILMVAVVTTCLLILFYKHQHRDLMIEKQHLIQQRNQLQVEWTQILIEHSSLASPIMIDTTARKQLNMKAPDADQIKKLSQTE